MADTVSIQAAVSPANVARLAARMLPKIEAPSGWLKAKPETVEHIAVEATTGISRHSRATRHSQDSKRPDFREQKRGYGYPAGWLTPWEVLCKEATRRARLLLEMAGGDCETAELAMEFLPPVEPPDKWSSSHPDTLHAAVSSEGGAQLSILCGEAVKRAHILLNAASGIVRNELDEYQRADCEADEEMKQMMEDRESLGKIFDKRGGRDLSTKEALKAAWPKRSPQEHTLSKYWELYVEHCEEGRRRERFGPEETRRKKLSEVESDLEDRRRLVNELKEEIRKKPIPLNLEIDCLENEANEIKKSLEPVQWQEYRPSFNRAQFMLEMAYFRKWLRGGGIERLQKMQSERSGAKGGEKTQRDKREKKGSGKTENPASASTGKSAIKNDED